MSVYSEVKLKITELKQLWNEQTEHCLTKLFSHQYAQKFLMDEDERSRVWVKRLRDVLKTMNSETKRVTGKEPADAIVLKEVSVRNINYKRPVGYNEVRLPLGEFHVRYLYAPREYEGGDVGRATDPIWSLGIYIIERSQIFSNQPILYFLGGKDAPRRG
mgnify:FL=1